MNSKTKSLAALGCLFFILSGNAPGWDVTPLDLDGFEGETVAFEVSVEDSDWVAAGTVCDALDWDFEFQLDGEVANGTATWGQDLANPFSGGMLTGICSNQNDDKITVFSVSLLEDFIVEGTEFAAIKFEHCDSPSLCTDKTLSIEIFDEGSGGGGVPEISIEEVADAAEPDQDGAFLIELSTPAPRGGLHVDYLVEGTAEPGLDYVALSGSVVIPEGRIDVLLTVEVKNDNLVEPPETVKVILLESDAYTVIPQLARATITIVDSDEILTFYINEGLNDAWWDMSTPGQGFFIIVLPDSGQIFLAWFTYDTERPPSSVTAILGDEGHRWLTALGFYDGNKATLAIELTRGGVFNSATPKVVQSADGTIMVEFHDCENGTITFNIPSINLQGVIPIKRIAPDNISWCETLNAQMQTAR
jgi:hypothetical protein